MIEVSAEHSKVVYYPRRALFYYRSNQMTKRASGCTYASVYRNFTSSVGCANNTEPDKREKVTGEKQKYFVPSTF